MLRKFLSIALIMIFGLGLSQKGLYYQQKIKYKMDIDVDAINFTYKGKQSIEYTNNSPDQLDFIYIHVHGNAFKSISRIEKKAKDQIKNSYIQLKKEGISSSIPIVENQESKQNVHWIKQNGENVKFEIQETIIKVYLNEPLKPKSITSLSMEWSSNIPIKIGKSTHNKSEDVDIVMTHWYPKISRYDYDGWATSDYLERSLNSSFSDFDITIKLDKNYVIGAGGVLENSSDIKADITNSSIKSGKNDKATWKWTAKNILDFVWVANKHYSIDQFTVLGGPKIYFVYKKSEKTKYWKDTKPYLTKYFQIMNSRFGQYTWPSYTFIQGDNNSMEYGTCTMISSEFKSLKELCELMFHKISYSWYQQMLATNRNMEEWMNEGLARYTKTYVSNQIFPQIKPQPNPFIESINSYINFVKTGRENSTSSLKIHDEYSTAYSISPLKGELFLIELGYIIGEQNLAKTMKQYYEEWNMKHPTIRDFMHIAQKISGMDLKWFYNYWINTTKTIDYSIKNITYGSLSTTITLINNGTLPMPIDFNILTKDRQILTYHIPISMMHTPKTKDIYGPISVMPFWYEIQKDYEITIPYNKSQIQAMGIDFSQRLADVNPIDNFIEVK